MNTMACILLLTVTQTVPQERPETTTRRPEAKPEAKIDLKLGRGVVNREIEDSDDTYFETETVYAWTELTGLHVGHVDHVWIRDGKEISRYSLAVAGTRTFRTWSRHRVQPGNYTVEVRAPDGRVLSRKSFHVFEDDDENGC